MTEDEMVGWHHRLDGYEFEQAPGIGDGQEGLACCSPRGRKELDTTERLIRTEFRVKPTAFEVFHSGDQLAGQMVQSATLGRTVVLGTSRTLQVRS